jgi:hypothetical protein
VTTVFLVVMWDGYYLTLHGVFSTRDKAESCKAGHEEQKYMQITEAGMDAPFDMYSLGEGW